MTSKKFAIAIVGCVLLCLSACAKKYEMASTAPAREAKLAVTDRAADSTLAYEHEVAIEAEREKISALIEATRASCTANKQISCAILEVVLHDKGHYEGGRIKLRLAPAGVDAMVKTASTDSAVTSSKTSAEDLAQPLADAARQLATLKTYRDSLAGLMARKDTQVADLISISQQLAATQTQIEQLSGDQAQLRRRIDTDLLTISWHVPRAQVQSESTPVRDALRSFGSNFREAVGNVIEFLAQLVPWLVIGLPSLLLLRMFWRWTGNWLSRKVRAQ